jgi:UDP-glucose 4-epimerase
MSLMKKNCKPGEVYNICTGKSFSIKDIINCLIKISKYKPRIQISKVRLRSADVFDLRGSNKKINKANKWLPKYTNLDGFQKALKKTYDWFRKSENLNKYTNIKKYNV